MAILFGIYYQNKQMKAIYSTEGNSKPILAGSWFPVALLTNQTESLPLLSLSKNKPVALQLPLLFRNTDI